MSVAQETVYTVFKVIFTLFVFSILFIYIVGVPNSPNALLSDDSAVAGTPYYTHIYSELKNGLGKGLVASFSESSFDSTSGYGLNNRTNDAWDHCKAVNSSASVGEAQGISSSIYYTLNSGSTFELKKPY